MEYASAGRSPFTNEQVVSIAYTTVLKTGIFPDETKEWRKLARNLKIWDEFKLRFTEAHADLQEASETARTSWFQSNNAEESTIHQDTVEAVANLVNATVADRESIAALTNTVARLTVQAATINEKLVKDLTENKHLSATSAGTNSDPRMEVSYTHYCWTHGPKCSHTSRNYDRHALDHKADATHLPLAIRKIYIFPSLSNNSVLYLGQFYDNGYVVQLKATLIYLQHPNDR